MLMHIVIADAQGHVPYGPDAARLSTKTRRQYSGHRESERDVMTRTPGYALIQGGCSTRHLSDM
jgi:hypothetical protein